MASDQEKIKYYAYKHVYKKKNDPTPSGRKTWKSWFLSKFGEDIDQYHKRVLKKRKRNKS